MTAKLVKWASSDGSITKSWLSGRRNAVFLLPVVGFSYDGSRIEGHLGNVGLLNTVGYGGTSWAEQTFVLRDFCGSILAVLAIHLDY